ncbi:MAG: SpoIID/LytB domain-containing protein [Thermocrispum sp.]
MRQLKALAVTLLAMAVVAGTAGVAAGREHFVPGNGEVRLTGHGYGHGIGMSQYGAEGAARRGRTWQQIVGFYYPGTGIGDAGGNIRVLITADTTDDVEVRPVSGLRLRDLRTGRTWALPGRAGIKRWRIYPTGWVHRYEDGRWRRWAPPGQLAGDSEFYRSGNAPIALALPGGSTKPYRGRLRSTHGNTVNVLPLEQYLRGVVPLEMPASWSSHALRSQVVAARTYAVRLRAANSARYYQICDTTSCQVYGGAGGEHSRTDAAIRAVAGKVLRHEGAPALTMFSSSSGGWTADGGMPYLVAKRDPWDGWSGNPVHTWRKTLTATSIERAYPAVGRLVAINVVRRDGNGQWGGRVERLVLEGTSGDVTLTGRDMRFRFGLRSHWFKSATTAIGNRWRRIGGPSSKVGDLDKPEYLTAGGAGQVFQRGRIYWSKPSGAREVYGRILQRYLGLGGAKSQLGFPTTGEYDVKGGRASDFQGGRLVWHRSTNTVTVHYS